MGAEIKKVERNMNIEILRVFSLFLIFFVIIYTIIVLNVLEVSFVF